MFILEKTSALFLLDGEADFLHLKIERWPRTTSNIAGLIGSIQKKTLH